jgi:mRNA-degrading endonuclease RelE of RelBE toxin-antitoxin system
MTFDIIIAPTAREDLNVLRATDRSAIEHSIDIHLRHEPHKESKSRIKRLRGLQSPQYRLRVDDFRVLYDVEEMTVHVLRIIPKAQLFETLGVIGIQI